MNPILFELGGFRLYSFGSFIALGAVVGTIVVFKLSQIRRLPTKNLFDLVLISLLAGLIGARIGYYLLYLEQFQSFWQLFYFWQGGLLASSGIVSGLAAFIWLTRRYQLPLAPMLDIGVLSFLLGWAVGKIGCHLSFCSIGRFSSSLIAFQSTVPVDLLSVVSAGILFVVLLWLWQREVLKDGLIFLLAVEGFVISEALIKTQKVDFGEGLSGIEAAAYLVTAVITYLIFWRKLNFRWKKSFELKRKRPS